MMPRNPAFPVARAVLVTMLIAGCDRGADSLSPVAASAQRADTLAPSLVIRLDSTVRVFAGLAVGDDGRIYVAEREKGVVVVHDAGGERRLAFGDEAEPPLARPCCPTFHRGLLWVRDGGNRRYVGWRVDAHTATVAATVPMAHADAASRAPIAFDEAGRLVDAGLHRDEEGSQRRHHFHLGEGGRVERTHALPLAPPESTGMRMVRRRVGDRNMTYYVVSPYPPAELIADGPGGMYAYGLSSRYEIAWYDAHGALLHTIRGEGVARPPLGETERAAAEAQVSSIAEQVGVPAADLGLAVPDAKQPLNDAWFDRAGNLWVEFAQPEGELRRAHVYDRTGTRVRDLAWPASVQLREGNVSWAGGDASSQELTVWGFTADSTGAAIVKLESKH